MAQSNYTPLFNLFYPAAGTAALTGSGHYVAGIFQLKPGATVVAIECYCTASTGGVVDVQLETLNSSDEPTGTLIGTNASLLAQSVSANTWYSWTLTSAYAVPSNAVTYAGAVIRWNSGSATWRTRVASNMSYNTYIPRLVEALASTNYRYQNPAIVVQYSDGTYALGCVAYTTINANSFNDSSDPDEIGNAFTPINNCYITGVQFIQRIASGATGQLRIYDDALNVLTTDAECTVSATEGSSSTPYMVLRRLKNAVPLIGGRRYVVALKATSTTTNAFYDYNSVFNTQALSDSATGLAGVAYAARNNSTGVFTETAAKLASIVPIVDCGYSLVRQCNTGGFCG